MGARLVRSFRTRASRAAQPVLRAVRQWRYAGSQDFWERRYRDGGTSGPGSYGKFAVFKADVLNDFVSRHDITSVIDFGCGDGNQLGLAQYPRYVGLDVSQAAIDRCRASFGADRSKQFHLYPSAEWTVGTPPLLCDLAISLDVVYHLTEDAVFERYMHDVFSAAERFVAIYSSDSDDRPGLLSSPHIRHHPIRRYVAEKFPGWALEEVVPNRHPWDGNANTSSWADFFFYRSTGAAD